MDYDKYMYGAFERKAPKEWRPVPGERVLVRFDNSCDMPHFATVIGKAKGGRKWSRKKRKRLRYLNYDIVCIKYREHCSSISPLLRKVRLKDLRPATQIISPKKLFTMAMESLMMNL